MYKEKRTRTRKTRTVMLVQWGERGEDGDNIVSQQHPSWQREPFSGGTSITCARRIHAPPIAQKESDGSGGDIWRREAESEREREEGRDNKEER